MHDRWKSYTYSSPRTGDIGINLVFRFDSIAPGGSEEFTYTYILDGDSVGVAVEAVEALNTDEPSDIVSGNNVPFRTSAPKPGTCASCGAGECGATGSECLPPGSFETVEFTITDGTTTETLPLCDSSLASTGTGCFHWDPAAVCADKSDSSTCSAPGPKGYWERTYDSKTWPHEGTKCNGGTKDGDACTAPPGISPAGECPGTGGRCVTCTGDKCGTKRADTEYVLANAASPSRNCRSTSS